MAKNKENNSKNQILALIEQKQGITAKEILANFALSKAMIFRHLKNLLAQGKVIKIGKTPQVRYFPQTDLSDQTATEQKFFYWALTGDNKFAKEEWLCRTRDVFQGREEKLLTLLKNLLSEDALYLLVGAAGEIGNNSFDHNLGNWRDQAGALFATDFAQREILLADRGQGVLATIKRVRPRTATDEEALTAAFTEIISGRYPERRGNGLKYVKKAIQQNNLYLEFYSGRARAKIAGGNFTIEKIDKNIPGVLALIKF